MEDLLPTPVSVVICAYTDERWVDLLRSVDAAAQALDVDDQLIVVIDHNDELLARVAREFASSKRADVLVVPSTETRGLSGARNTGIRHATGGVIAFIDDDAAIEPGWREKLIGHFGDSDVVAVGGYAEPVWPKARPQWLPPECDWTVGCSYVGLPTAVASVRNVIGCNMSFRRETLAAMGGFNTEVGRVGKHPVGCEETELCIRIAQQWSSKKILFDPDIRVKHYVSNDRTKLEYLIRRSFGEGISKRQISRLVGSKDATKTERSYLAKTVPSGLIYGVRQSLSSHARREEPGALFRSGVLALSVAAAGTGYLYALAHEGRQTEPSRERS